MCVCVFVCGRVWLVCSCLSVDLFLENEEGKLKKTTGTQRIRYKFHWISGKYLKKLECKMLLRNLLVS